jgi:hypothetical protein
LTQLRPLCLALFYFGRQLEIAIRQMLLLEVVVWSLNALLNQSRLAKLRNRQCCTQTSIPVGTGGGMDTPEFSLPLPGRQRLVNTKIPFRKQCSRMNSTLHSINTNLGEEYRRGRVVRRAASLERSNRHQ